MPLTNNEISVVIKYVVANQKKLEQQIKQLENRYKTLNGQVGKLAISQKGVKGQAERLTKTLKKQSTTWKTTNTVVGQHGNHLKRTQVKYKEIGGEMKKFSRAQERVNSKWMTMNPALRSVSSSTTSLLTKFTKFRWLLVNFALAAGVAFGTFKLLIKPFIDLEVEMANVRKTTNLSKESIKELRGELIDLSLILPVSAIDLAKIATVAGQLGIKGVANIKNFTATVGLMTTATELTAEDAATSLAKIAQAFNLPISDVNNLGSVINELSNTTAATSSEIVRGLTRVGAAAANLNIGVQTVAALEATLISAGMRAERAGTRLRSSLNLITINVEGFAKLTGTTFQEFSRILENDAEQALRMILESLKEINSTTERSRKITELFGKVGGFAIQTLVNNYDELEENISNANTEMEIGLSLIKETAIQSGTISAQWKLLLNDIKQVGLAEKGIIADFVTGARVIAETRGKGFKPSPLSLVPGAGGIDAFLGFTRTTSILEEKILKARKEMNSLAIQTGATSEEIMAMNDDVNSLSNSMPQMLDQLERYNLMLEQQKNAQEEVGGGITKIENKFTSLQDALTQYIQLQDKFNNAITFEDFEELSVLFQFLKEDIESAFGAEKLALLVDFAKKGVDVLTSSVDELAEAQRRASRLFSLTNKKLSTEIKEIRDVYNSYVKARFEGEKEQLENIHNIELAIKRERLEQLRLNDTVEDTNDILDQNKTSYQAWVETVEQFIRSAIEAGNDLGKNVSGAVKKFQTLLLSTSKFEDISGTKEENKNLKELQRQRDIAQLQFELGIGEQKFQVQQYIDELNRKGEVEWSTARTAINAIGNQKEKMDDLIEKQEDLKEKWEDVSTVFDLTKAGFVNAADIMKMSIRELINETETLIERLSEANISTSGGGGGGGSSSFSGGGVTVVPGSYTGEGLIPVGTPGTQFGDFMFRPGEKPVSFSSQDTIVGFKGDSPFGEVTIENINITGISGDPEEFAYKFAEELRRELKTG